MIKYIAMSSSFKTVFLLIFIFSTSWNVESEFNGSLSKQASPPKIGDTAPEINLLSTDRTTKYKLSDLRGKMVLLNFWASLAAPCRFENPNLVKTYKQYKDKTFQNASGFTIYSVSLDANVDNWKNAIAKDGLIWPYHVSDLKAYDSEVVALYGVRSIPYNYLIDGEGKIVAINLRGSQLGQTLTKYLK